MGDWIVLESGLHPTVLERMGRNLAGLPHRADGGSILLPDSAQTRRALGIMDELLACHQRILHYTAPGAAKPYKPLEREREALFRTIHGLMEDRPGASGPAFLADLLHRLVWAQGLPNTNHRSTLALVNLYGFAGGEGAPSPEQQRHLADAFIAASKPLIQEKEFAPEPDALAQRHHRIAADYVDALLAL